MSTATINWNGVAGSTPDTNSCMITYTAGTTLYPASAGFTALLADSSTLMYAIDAFLAGDSDGIGNHGWSRVANTNASSGGGVVGNYCYKAANLNDANGVGSYKYMILSLGTSGKIFCKVYESIVADGTAPTNLAYQSDVIFGTISTLTGSTTTYTGKLWIGASARHFVMHSYSNGLYGYNTSGIGPIGCFEFTRTSPYDLAATSPPKFCHLAGQYISSLFPTLTPPRNKYGSTTTAYGTHISLCGNVLTYPTYKFTASSICYITFTNTSVPYGADGCFYNLVMLTSNAFSIIGDDVQIPVSTDSKFGNEKFIDPDGTLTSYWVVGGTSGYRYAVPK